MELLDRLRRSDDDSSEESSPIFDVEYNEDGSSEVVVPTEKLTAAIASAGGQSDQLDDIVEERTVEINEDLDEDDFFSTRDGLPTNVNRYDLEKAVPFQEKTAFLWSRTVLGKSPVFIRCYFPLSKRERNQVLSHRAVPDRYWRRFAGVPPWKTPDRD